MSIEECNCEQALALKKTLKEYKEIFCAECVIAETQIEDQRKAIEALLRTLTHASETMKCFENVMKELSGLLDDAAQDIAWKALGKEIKND